MMRATWIHWLKFNAVGGMGIGVQLIVLTGLKSGLHRRSRDAAGTTKTIISCLPPLHRSLRPRRVRAPSRSVFDRVAKRS